MTTTPADNPCNCRACGALILNEVTSMCEDCEADMNAYYDERSDRDCDCGYDDDRACPNCSTEEELEDDGSEAAHREWIRANDRDD